MAAYHTAFKPEKNKYILEVIYDHGNDNQTHIFKFESHANRQKVMDKIEEG